MAAVPGWAEIAIALLFILFLPVKVALYFGLFSLFYLRVSTSWRTSLNLANYSEFGLIIGALAASAGWLSNEWLAVFAVTLSISFMLSAPLVNFRDNLYQSWRPSLKRLERPKRLSGEENLDLRHIRMVVFGMGRVGTAAYSAMDADYPECLAGVEIDQDKANRHIADGRNVIIGDVTNPDFWTRAPELIDDLSWVLLTLPTHMANMNAALLLKEMGYAGHIAATTKYPDEQAALKEIGVNHTFNIYAEAGLGFANELRQFHGSA